MKCPECNYNNPADQDLCKNCGYDLETHSNRKVGSPNKRKKKEESILDSALVQKLKGIGEDTFNNMKKDFGIGLVKGVTTVLDIAETTAYCQNCLQLVQKSDTFCRHCGQKFNSQQGTLDMIRCNKCGNYYAEGMECGKCHKKGA